MKRAWAAALLTLVLARGARGENKPSGMEDMFDLKPPMSEEFREISFLNLINGLYLSTEQVKQIVAVCRESQMASAKWQPRIESHRQQLKKAYSSLRDELIAKGLPDEGVSPTQHRAHEAQESLERIRFEYGKAMKSYERHIEFILTENQRTLIDEFHPCLIPPRVDGAARVGQAKGQGGPMLHFIEMSRHIPDHRVAEFKRNGYGRHMEHFERKFGKITDAEAANFRKAIDRYVAKARALSDSDFEIAKETLAQELSEAGPTPPGRPKSPKSPQGPGRDREDRLGHVGRQFLDPNLVPLLIAYEKARLQRDAG